MSAAELANAIERMGLDPSAYVAERLGAQTKSGDEISIRRLAEVARLPSCSTKKAKLTD